MINSINKIIKRKKKKTDGPKINRLSINKIILNPNKSFDVFNENRTQRMCGNQINI